MKKNSEFDYEKDYNIPHNKIGKLRRESAELLEGLFEDILKLSVSTAIPDFVFAELGTAFYYARRYEKAALAMKLAIEAASLLPPEEQTDLVYYYGNLADIHEANENIPEAIKAAEKRLELSIKFNGEDDDITRYTINFIDKLKRITKALKGFTRFSYYQAMKKKKIEKSLKKNT